MKKKTVNGKKNLIYIRYWFPVVTVVILLLLMCVPCLRFTTADGGTGEAISMGELMRNSWDQVRAYLFGGGTQKDAGTVHFARGVLIALIAFWFLFFLAACVSLYVLIYAFRYFRNPDSRGTENLVFMTLMPNRAVVCIGQALIFPLLCFPHFLLLMYDSILHYPVKLSFTFPEPLIFGVILYVAGVVLTVVSAPRESALGWNPFTKRLSLTDDNDGYDEDDCDD